MNLEVKNGSFAWPGGDKILKDVSFTASSGDLVAVLGPNGAGKTTLLRCLMLCSFCRRGGCYFSGFFCSASFAIFGKAESSAL